MLKVEGLRLPSLFTVGGYKIYFWSGDIQESIHVHVSKGKPTEEATKIWMTKSGGCIIAHNKSRIPKRELEELMEVISAQFFYICSKWKSFFLVDEIEFYC